MGGDVSKVKSLENGSPQGNGLSYSSNFLTNTQYDVLKDLFAELSQYAEDAAAWKSAKSKLCLVQLMQTILVISYKWTVSLGIIKVSAGKTEVIMHNYETIPRESILKLKVSDQTLEFKSQGKCLGMTLDNKLSWKNTLTHLLKDARKT